MLIKTSVGIELGTKDLRIAVVRTTLGKLQLVQSFVISNFRDLTPEEQKNAVSGFVKKHKIPSTRVFLSIPRDQGVVRQIELPVEVKDKLKATIELQLETLCPWPVEEVYWDFSVDSAKTSKVLVVTVAFIPRATLDPWVQFFRSSRLPLTGASLSALGCAHGATALWTDQTPVIVIDCEPNYVEGSLIQNGRVASITIQGTDTSGHAKTIIERLITSGRVTSPGSARLIAYGGAVTSLEGVDSVPLPIEKAKTAGLDRFGAIASAMLGLKRTGFDCNLIPRALRHRRSQLQLIPTYVLVGLTALLGFAFLAREPYQMSSYAYNIEQEIEKIAPEVGEVAAQETELNALSEKYRVLLGHFKNRDQNLEALRELARVLPSTAWLSNYSYQEGNLTLSGFADSASEIQKVLEDSSEFKDVQFTTSVVRESNGKDRFVLKAALEVGK